MTKDMFEDLLKIMDAKIKNHNTQNWGGVEDCIAEMELIEAFRRKHLNPMDLTGDNGTGDSGGANY